jgi:uncharacterized membrane protein YphA (DoxX/SURF4 family)
MNNTMVRTGRLFYGVALAAYGFHQFFYPIFRPVLLPAWPSCIPGQGVCVYLASAALLGAGLAILFGKTPRTVALVAGGLFLLLFCLCQIPYQILVDPYSRHLGVWGDAEKELAFSGGGFLVAGSFPEGHPMGQKKYALKRLLEKIIPFGRIFFCITMISFGIDHFLYTDPISTLVPAWIPGHIFWTYFSAVALIGSGFCWAL